MDRVELEENDIGTVISEKNVVMQILEIGDYSSFLRLESTGIEA